MTSDGVAFWLKINGRSAGWEAAGAQFSCPECGDNDKLLVSQVANKAYGHPTYFCLVHGYVKPLLDGLLDLLIENGLLRV